MKVNKRQMSCIKDALNYWKKKKLISQDTATVLEEEIEVTSFNWFKFAKFSFWITLACGIITISTIFQNKHVIAFVQNSPSYIIFFIFAAIACVFYTIAYQTSIATPLKKFKIESLYFIAVLMTNSSLFYFVKMMDITNYFHHLLLLSFLIYAAIGLFTKSNVVWIFALLNIGSWMGAETGYASGWSMYYLGMGYPLRFMLFGFLLTIFALLMQDFKKFKQLFPSTLIMGMLYIFISSWILSLIGNNPSSFIFESRTIELLMWSLLFGLFAILAILHGLKYDNNITKSFGISFLLINLYTKYFEYFWENTNKILFFAILTLSFWALGSFAEKKYNKDISPKS